MTCLAQRSVFRRFYLGLDALVDLSALTLGVEAFLCAPLPIVLLAVLVEGWVCRVELSIADGVVLWVFGARIVLGVITVAGVSRTIDLMVGAKRGSTFVDPNI